ncbi:MAG: TMEM175 family protein [Alphaproteobacteria bacterium]|nr:TMEM175 family protein [Alphaproteobacteria bacterium]
MKPERLNAFSDGVIAILITIMVLELRVPHGAEPADLVPLIPVFLSYILSFTYIAIYWNNHHHLMHASAAVDGLTLWSNIHLLFWLSLIPFATGWMGQNNFARVPTAVYGLALLMPAIAYFLLQRAIIRLHGRQTVLAHALGRDVKGKASLVLYAIGMVTALFAPWVAGGFYAVVALMWVVPDRRIERAMKRNS